MGARYKGALASKLPPITILGAADRDKWQEYERVALARHEALFREFDLEPPAPDDAKSPAWRDLAIALARRHVPAFAGKQGRPATARDQNLRWFLASVYFQRRDNLTLRDADRRVAIHFEADPQTVLDRLKDMRRLSEYKPDGPLLAFLDQIAKEVGSERFLESLAQVLEPNHQFSEFLNEQIERLSRWPY